jgi:hypothetical protein
MSSKWILKWIIAIQNSVNFQIGGPIRSIADPMAATARKRLGIRRPGPAPSARTVGQLAFGFKVDIFTATKTRRHEEKDCILKIGPKSFHCFQPSLVSFYA